MNSAMTITQWEVDNSNRESAKPAKLSQEKVFNLDNQRRKFYAKNVETANLLRNTSVGIQSKEFLDKFNMTIINKLKKELHKSCSNLLFFLLCDNAIFRDVIQRISSRQYSHFAKKNK